jgi:hypothetical protein
MLTICAILCRWGQRPPQKSAARDDGSYNAAVKLGAT